MGHFLDGPEVVAVRQWKNERVLHLHFQGRALLDLFLPLENGILSLVYPPPMYLLVKRLDYLFR